MLQCQSLWKLYLLSFHLVLVACRPHWPERRSLPPWTEQGAEPLKRLHTPEQWDSWFYHSENGDFMFHNGMCFIWPGKEKKSASSSEGCHGRQNEAFLFIFVFDFNTHLFLSLSRPMDGELFSLYPGSACVADWEVSQSPAVRGCRCRGNEYSRREAGPLWSPGCLQGVSDDRRDCLLTDVFVGEQKGLSFNPLDGCP